MSGSKILFYFCLSFISGIFFSSYIAPYLAQIGFLNTHLVAIFGGLILGLVLISVFWSSNFKKNKKRKRIVVVGFCLLILVAGIGWHYQAKLKSEHNKLAALNKQQLTFTGIVTEEPDLRTNHTKLTLTVTKINGSDLKNSKSEKVLVTTSRYPEYRYGDRLKVKGIIKTPTVFEDFNYKQYLAKDKIYGVVYYPQIRLIQSNQGNSIYAKILAVKNKLREVIYKNLSPPHSAILGAVTLGDKRRLSEELKQKLNRAGVRHITAISGMHVTILTAILMSLLIGIGLHRSKAFYFAIGLIALFITMTGFQTSAIRAGIIGSLFLWAQHLGRTGSSGRGLALAAAVMLIHNPLLLKADVGFQLSFLAVIGIVLLSSTFQSWLKKVPRFLNLRNILAMTLSAQVFALPILIFHFKHFSVVTPFTNILIVPLLPYIMGLGFLFALLGLIWGFLGWLISLGVWLLLSFVLTIINFFANLPFAYPALEASWIWLVIIYLILVLITWKLKRKKRWKFLDY